MNASSKRYSGYVPVTLSGTVLLASLLYNLFVFSALASHPQIGTALRNAIRNDAPIVSIYVLVGDLVRVGPLATLGDASAAEIAAPIAEKIRSYPPGAVATLFGSPQSASQSQLQWSHQLLPFLLLLTAILWWRRPKPVHMMPRRR